MVGAARVPARASGAERSGRRVGLRDSIAKVMQGDGLFDLQPARGVVRCCSESWPSGSGRSRGRLNGPCQRRPAKIAWLAGCAPPAAPVVVGPDRVIALAQIGVLRVTIHLEIPSLRGAVMPASGPNAAWTMGGSRLVSDQMWARAGLYKRVPMGSIGRAKPAADDHRLGVEHIDQPAHADA